MAVLETHQRTELQEATLPPLPRYRFSREQYYRMAQMGLFEGKRVELIAGEIVEMTPVGPEHFAISDQVQEVFKRAFGKGYWVRFQGPLALGESEPEPDVAVVKGRRADYRTNHPESAVLVVEVADTSLEYDRTYKMSLYAQAGIPEYWIVNLRDQQVEVYREPAPMEGTVFGFGYKVREIRTPGEAICPLAKPDIAIKVEELLL
ncbi:MAG: Uma2 family endonuclease [Fimbriimonadales bacterium]|nr:Uma2 family endonuclease [Fimbriimonadales bacterium]